MLVKNKNLRTASAQLLDLDGAFSRSGIRRRTRAQLRRVVYWRTSNWAVCASRRLADVMLALFLIIMLSPAILVILGIAWLRQGGIRKEKTLGRWAVGFDRYVFCFPERPSSAWSGLMRLIPALFHILRGDMSFVGPRPIASHGSFANQPAAWKRYDLRPGLLSLWWLRKRANMAYTNEVGLDVEYVETSSLHGDLGIALRAIPQLLFGRSGGDAGTEVKLLGVRIDNLTMAEASQRVVALTEARQAVQICFVNADCFNIASRDVAYRNTLNAADLVLADGIGVRIAGTILRQKIRENINGTDMLPYLCAAMEESGKSVYLLGGKPGVAVDAAKWIREHYPRLKVAGFHHGYFADDEEQTVLRKIANTRSDVLLVAFGAPKQDKWIAQHKEQLGAMVAIGVGGLLDFYSGRIPRAPAWIRELGMEWMYRFSQEPRRMWRRYFVGNSIFVGRLVWIRIAARIRPRWTAEVLP